MKIVHSLWTKPMFKRQNRNDFDRFDGGWTDKKYNYMSWALSCLQFGKYYDQIELFTDNYGKEILIDRLELPYTKVHVVLDELNDYHADLWAIGKLYTYSLQEEPFLHVDGDAYIWEKFSSELENAPLVAQNIEEDFPYYRESINEVKEHFVFTPEFIEKLTLDNKLVAINAGIFGGNDINFIKEYTKEAFAFVDKNRESIPKINVGIFNTVYEQLLFFQLAQMADKSIHFLKENVNSDFEGLAEFSGISRYAKYIHVVGQYKKFKQTGEDIARRLLLDHPMYYFKINGLLKDLYI